MAWQGIAWFAWLVQRRTGHRLLVTGQVDRELVTGQGDGELVTGQGDHGWT